MFDDLQRIDQVDLIGDLIGQRGGDAHRRINKLRDIDNARRIRRNRSLIGRQPKTLNACRACSTAPPLQKVAVAETAALPPVSTVGLAQPANRPDFLLR